MAGVECEASGKQATGGRGNRKKPWEIRGEGRGPSAKRLAEIQGDWSSFQAFGQKDIDDLWESHSLHWCSSRDRLGHTGTDVTENIKAYVSLRLRILSVQTGSAPRRPHPGRMEPSLSEAPSLAASAERKPRRWGLTLAIRSSCRRASQLSGPSQPQGPGVQAPTHLGQERK